MNRNRNRWVRIVALFIVLALVLGVVATSLVLALSGNKSVLGTYSSSDGRTLALSKDGVATLTLPSIDQPISASYKVEGDVVTIYDRTTGSAEGISFKIEGKDLILGEGKDAQSWVRQEKK
jgi:hypothetical protein